MMSRNKFVLVHSRLPWITFTGNETLLMHFTNGNNRVSDNYRVCSIHFRNDDFQNSLHDRLLRNRFPTLFPPEVSAACEVNISAHQPSSNTPTPFVQAPMLFANAFEDSRISVNEEARAVDECLPEALVSIQGNQSPTNSSAKRSLFMSSTPSTPIPFTDPQPLTSTPASVNLNNSQTTSFSLNSSCDSQSQFSVAGPSSVSGIGRRRRRLHGKRITLADIGMSRLGFCSPRKRFLFKYGKKKEMELKRLDAAYNQVKQKLRNLEILKHKGLSYFDTIKGELPSKADVLMSSVARCSQKQPQGRRWTAEEKLLALSLFKKSPSCYSLLRCILPLPCRKTLTSYLNSIPFTTGVNRNVLAAISKAGENMKELEKYCILMFDEMSIRGHFQYIPSKDIISGYEDLGDSGRTSRQASYALVFMVRGLYRKWKQPISFYFSHSQIKSDNLVILIKKAIQSCHDAGLKVLATVCDMGSNNRKAIKSLGATVIQPYFLFDDQKIFTFFDPPHLLKSTRNLFLKYDIQVPMKTNSLSLYQGTASWTHLVAAYEKDKEHSGFKQLAWMTRKHICPQGKEKMKVKFAAQVFTPKVASYLSYGIQYAYMPTAALATANFIVQVGRIFDSLNGDAEIADTGKELRAVVTTDSGHVSFWNAAVGAVKRWKFLRGPRSIKYPPSQEGWLFSLRAILLLWDYLKQEDNFPGYLSPRSLNQDPLENLFGCIRAQCGGNHNPTVAQFIDSLKTCTVNGLVIRGAMGSGNCKKDDATLLTDFRSYVENGRGHSIDEQLSDVVQEVDNSFVSEATAPDEEDDIHQTASVAYLSGFLAKSALQSNGCESCRSALCSDDKQLFNLGIYYQESDEGASQLTYPSENLVKVVSSLISLAEEILNLKAHQEGIGRFISNEIREKVSFGWLHDSCDIHFEQIRKHLISGLIVKVIRNWCTRKNNSNLYVLPH